MQVDHFVVFCIYRASKWTVNTKMKIILVMTGNGPMMMMCVSALF